MSPRCKKARICECEFKGKAYRPTGIPLSSIEKIILHKDELEVLKLCDVDDLTQQQAGIRMGVSRGTIQRILSSARKKVATALTSCKAIIMDKNICK